MNIYMYDIEKLLEEAGKGQSLETAGETGL
jgi:hypothetical protein